MYLYPRHSGCVFEPKSSIILSNSTESRNALEKIKSILDRIALDTFILKWECVVYIYVFVHDEAEYGSSCA